MIRKLKRNEKEINRIMEIWKDATIKAHNFISKEYWINSYSIVKEQYIPIADTYVYEVKSEIRGFISVINGEFIGAVFVDVDYQGQGIGSELINHIKLLYNKLELAVYKENYESVNFYKKMNFTIKRESLNEETSKLEYFMTYEK